jgi:diguanylate cyclase (GGDEF)-like protein
MKVGYVSLRAKVLSVLLVALLLYSGVEFAIHHWILFPSFLRLEEHQAKQDLQRVRFALESEIDHLDKVCWDWASWDDTYDFVVSRDTEFVASNLVLSTFLDNRINLIYFYDHQGRPVWGESHELSEGEPLPLAVFSPPAQPEILTLPQELPAGKTVAEAKIVGILPTEHGPLLVSVRPVLTSDNLGPMRGTLVMGRLLDPDLVAELIERTRLIFSFSLLTGLPEEQVRLFAAEPTLARFDKSDAGRLLTVQGYPDLSGEPTFVLQVQSPRLFIQTMRLAMRHVVISLTLAGLALLVLLSTLLQRIVLGPLHNLTRHVRGIHSGGGLSARLQLERRDEIGQLANEFDLMMGEIEQKNAQLAEANSELQRLSQEDVLTTLANRRCFEDSLRKEWKWMLREQRPLSLILCDVDLFKQYNDTYGHLQGDQCLRAVAHALQKKVHRPGDLVARYGGEEFAAILVDTDLAGAQVVAEAFRQAVQQLQIPHRASSVDQYVTLSVGVASLVSEAGLEPEVLVCLADQALYLAKQQGRNRVQIQDLTNFSGYQPPLWPAGEDSVPI